jgi:hypothetical protein
VSGDILLKKYIKCEVHPKRCHEGLQRKVEVQFYSFFNIFLRWRRVVNTTVPPLYPREGDMVPTAEEVGWTSQPFGTAAENVAPAGIWSPDRGRIYKL